MNVCLQARAIICLPVSNLRNCVSNVLTLITSMLFGASAKLLACCFALLFQKGILLLMAGTLMDKAIEDMGASDKQWHLKTSNAPATGLVECPDSIPVEDFVANACRPCAKTIKSMNVLFDTHLNVAPCGAAAELGQHIANSNWESLPEAIQFKAPPPHGSKVDFIQVTKPNGNVDMLKVVYLPRPLSFQLATAICKGDVFVLVHRPGPWNIKKGIQWLLDRLGGYQVRWHHLQDKASAVSDSKPSWSPSNAELEEGVVFINAYAPDCDAQNEQTL